MRLVVRLFGLEVLAIEQGDTDDADDQAEDAAVNWVDLGTTTSVGYTVDPIPDRQGWEEGYEP